MVGIVLRLARYDRAWAWLMPATGRPAAPGQAPRAAVPHYNGCGTHRTRLLLRQRGSRGPRCLLLQLAMHPFMVAVILRRGGPDEMRSNAELQPPYRQPGQPARPVRSERRPVVATDRLWTTEVEDPLEHRLHRRGRRHTRRHHALAANKCPQNLRPLRGDGPGITGGGPGADSREGSRQKVTVTLTVSA